MVAAPSQVLKRLETIGLRRARRDESHGKKGSLLLCRLLIRAKQEQPLIGGTSDRSDKARADRKLIEKRR